MCLRRVAWREYNISTIPIEFHIDLNLDKLFDQIQRLSENEDSCSCNGLSIAC